MKKLVIITNLIVILMGFFTLYIGYALLSNVHGQAFIWGRLVQTPKMILFAIGGVFVLGFFVIIYAILCLRKGISCIKF